VERSRHRRVAISDRAAVPTRAPGAALDGLRGAAGFLTRLPVGAVASGTTGAAAFGLVGAGLGVVAATPLALGATDQPVLAAIAAVALLALGSGALHLDGLADTFDALAAPPGGADRARSDPRVGAAGAAALVLVLLADVACLAEVAAMGGPRAAAIVVAAVTVSRGLAPTWALLAGRRLRPPDGLGAWFADGTSGAAAAVSVVTAAVAVGVLVELAGPAVGLASIGGTMGSGIAGGAILARRRQLDGDGYGALVEVTFLAVLVAAVLLR